MQPLFLIATYSTLIVMASLAGGWLPSLAKLTHVRMQLMMSLVSGLMLGIAMLHMLPEASAHVASMTKVSGAMLAGLLVMFFLLRVFHVHGHGDLDHDGCHDHASHSHQHSHDSHVAGHRLNWLGLFFGLAIHTLLDGVALSASVVADARHSSQSSGWFGLGTFLAVLLHKPLDALAITSLMQAGGWTKRSQSVVNLGYSLMCPIGALVFWFGATQLAAEHSSLIGYALAFSAGFFLCIALGDLLPEVQFHSHNRVSLSAALLVGVAMAIGIEWTHSHQHDDSQHHVPGHQHSEHHDHH